MTLICGIEEAGRGPVIGPMVMCGIVIDEKDTDKLLQIGVKDSKLLTPKQRENLFEKIKKIAKSYEIIIISPKESTGKITAWFKAKLDSSFSHSFKEFNCEVNQGL